ncbi:MAG: hypothetical protein HRT36_00220 [Alphaproteobacteria bacterium]|nr:hypothetical protein [Alphaproteobacteria bacterium]
MTGEEIDQKFLGGARVRTQKSGMADGVFDSDLETWLAVRRLVSFLPQNNRAKPPQVAGIPAQDQQAIGCFNPRVPPHTQYNMCDVINNLADDADFFELIPPA